MDRGVTSTALVWRLIAVVGAVALIWMHVVGLRLEWASASGTVLACAALAMGAAFYRCRRPDERLATSLACTAQLIAFSTAGALLSYAVARTGGALWDDTLLSWDRALGLDWRAYLAFVDARPRLGLVLSLAYRSIMLQILGAVLVLGFSGHLAACREFVLAMIVAALASILISAAMPAMAMFVHLGLNGAQDYPHLAPAAAFVHVADLAGLRDGSLRVVGLDRLEGIITFPSFHAALGVLFIRAFWRVRWTRWIGLTLNVAMIAATPIDGGHYFVDVIAGIGIAAASIAVASRLCTVNGRAHARPEPMPSPMPLPSPLPAVEIEAR